MAYRLSIVEDVGGSVRTCAREQLDDAVAQLAGAGDDPADAVHEARKDLKKTRALLRLVRPALGTSAYRQENATLRDAGRALSGERDAVALVATAEQLAERYAGRLPAEAFAELRDGLAAQGAERGGDGAAAREAVLATLRDAAARVDAWPLERCDWATVVAGATRAYARGRDAFAVARADPDPELVHAWRKRAKDLWYHRRLLTPVWPEVLGAEAEEAHRLTELLGDDHDLAVLAAWIDGAAPLAPLADAERPALRALAEERGAELRAGAARLGRRLYAESPKAFARRLDACVATALAERRAEGTA